MTAPRWGALIGGSALAVAGLTQRSKPGIALAAGGGLLAFYGALARGRAQQISAQSSVLLNCSPQRAYQFWHDFENLPRFMRHIHSVSSIGERRSRWVAAGPLGTQIQWDAEIVADRENELIAWRSLAGSDVAVDGVVRFQAVPHRGTLVTANLIFQPPAGRVGRAVAQIMGKAPHFLMRQDLRRFKALVETGEIPTTEGQPHGRRTRITAIARVLSPAERIRRGARIPELIAEKRRAS